MTALKKGFTLIELLIVIAILGVLAVVVLVAINPVQQLARTRDAGRISTVQQLGHSVEAFYVSHDAEYPATWDELVTAGEINNLPGEVNNTLTSLCATGDDLAGNLGWCFDADATTDPPTFAVWSTLEADTNSTVGTCAADGSETAYAAYLSAAGRGCIVCLAAGEPTAAMDEDDCDN